MDPMAAISPALIHSQAPKDAAAPRLVRAAHEFEGQMMKELLKPMTDSDPLTGDDDGSGSGGALGEFATEALGRALSERGGFGVATKIVNQLTHSGNTIARSGVTGGVHGNTP
jgi:Rod binding domain-containing protein